MNAGIPTPNNNAQGAPSFNPPPKILSKKEYLKEKGSPDAKKAAKLSLVFFLVTVVIALFAIFTVLNSDIYKLPVVSFFGEDVADELKHTLEDDTEEMVDDMKWDLENNRHKMEKSEIKATKKVIDAFDEFEDNPSIMNLNTIANVVRSEAEEIDSDRVQAGYEDSELESSLIILNVVFWAVIVMGLFPLLFVFLSYNAKSIALGVLGIIFSLSFNICLAGIVFALLYIVSVIVMCVFHSKVNKEYKAYKASL
ncbi:MAG: hypothetical protein E7582_06825 [Ruminococcaceae bacterium]|nr:hypothetical protein [Oscillospiraceae bacterium]